jgi:hypothetical protein
MDIPQEKPFCPPAGIKEYYYYYFAERLPISLVTDEIALQFVERMNQTTVASFAARASVKVRTDSVRRVHLDQYDPMRDVWSVRLIPGLSAAEIETLIDSIKMFREVWYAGTVFLTRDRLKVWLNDEFSVKLLDSSKLDFLNSLKAQHGLAMRESQYLRNVYYLSAPKTLCRNSLEMANYCYENFGNIFEWCSPNWISMVKATLPAQGHAGGVPLHKSIFLGKQLEKRLHVSIVVWGCAPTYSYSRPSASALESRRD